MVHEETIEERMARLETKVGIMWTIVWGAVALVLVTVGGAVMAYVVRHPQ
jgi:hypothetical protein